MNIDPTVASVLGGLAVTAIGWGWRYVTSSIGHLRDELSEHKLHVAETYTAKTDMTAFDVKITNQLVRIEAKLDQQISRQ